jgi:hypothetical protein
VNDLLKHFGYDAEQGCYTGYPTAQQEHDRTELGERVAIAYQHQHERDARAWPA